MKVRLKLGGIAAAAGEAMFQFHEGPIKTAAGINPYNAASSFQFHEGPIKTKMQM